MFQAGDVLLFTDWTLLRLFPPLRAMWAAIGTQAKVAITGQNARRVLFGTIEVVGQIRTARYRSGLGNLEDFRPSTSLPGWNTLTCASWLRRRRKSVGGRLSDCVRRGSPMVPSRRRLD